MASILEGADAPGSPYETTYRIEHGGSFIGTLSGPSDYDSVLIDLQLGMTYTFTMTGVFDRFASPGFGVSSLETSSARAQVSFLNNADEPEPLIITSSQVQDFFTDGESILTFSYTAALTGTYGIYFGATNSSFDTFYEISVTRDSLPQITDPGSETPPPPPLPLPGTGTDGADNVTLGNGNNVFYGGGGSDLIIGGSGNDTLFGESGKDTLFGEGGDDVLDGGSGNDVLFGGDGNDTLIGATGNDILHGDAGDDSLSGGAGSDTLYGGDGSDTLDGGDGDDVLTGGAGADVFRLLSGRDTVTDFEDGVDRIDVTALNVSDISMLTVIQTVAGTRVVATGGAELFLAGITATDLSNDDFILSEPEVVVPTPGADIFNGTAADDYFAAGSGADLLYGGLGRDTLFGDSGEDTIFGGSQNDLIYGGSGDDQLFGEAGNDVIFGDSGNDKIEGGGGNDYIDGGADNDRLYGGSGHDTLIGEQGNDKLWGESGDDVLFGGAGKDELYGGTGNDTLSGGLGDDILTGGAGADVFVFEDRMRADVVTDFELGIDKLDFSAFGFTDLSALTLTQIGSNAEVRVSDRDHVTLLNIDVADLTVDDFIFAPDPGWPILM